MTSDDVLERERIFHDQLAKSIRAEDRPPREPDHLENALHRVLGTRPRRVLDLGCGLGDLTLQLLARGHEVVGLDVSAGMLELARRRVALYRPDAASRVEFVRASAEATGLADRSFDAIVGKWILHHVDVGGAAAEGRRLLRPQGEMVLIENWGQNALLRFARDHVAGRAGIPRFGTADEHPLMPADIAEWSRRLPETELFFPDFCFFTLLDRQIFRHRRPRIGALLGAADRAVYEHLPGLHRYSFHVVVRSRV